MKSLFSTVIELQMDPDQRERSARICAAINRFLAGQDRNPDDFSSFGEFVRSDEWDDYLDLNTQDPALYPLFEIDDRGFYASDIDFIHAYCMDGNRLSSFINAVDRDTVTAESVIGQVFYYGLPSLSTWFNRHEPRIAQVKAFELLLANLLEAETTIAGYFVQETPLNSPFITPRRAVVELHLQGLHSGVYGKYRERERQVIAPAVLDALLSPLGHDQAEGYATALASVKRQISQDGGVCEDARVEIAQNLLVGTIINPGFFLMISGESLQVIRESTQVKTRAWALECGFDPEFAIESVEFVLLSIDPQLMRQAQLQTQHWYRPRVLGVPQLEGALTGMGGYQSAPFAASYQFFSKHYGDELALPIISMLETNHHHFKNVLAEDQGYHPVVDQLLQAHRLPMAAIRSVGSQMMLFGDSLARYGHQGLSYAALMIFHTPDVDRHTIDASLLQFIVGGCPEARSLIISELDRQAVISLEDLKNNGLSASDAPVLMKKFRIEDADDLFARELGL